MSKKINQANEILRKSANGKAETGKNENIKELDAAQGVAQGFFGFRGRYRNNLVAGLKNGAG